MRIKPKNAIVLSPYYKGTSFEDIASALQLTALQSPTPITLIGETKPLTNTLSGSLLDDQRYIKGQIKILKKLILLKSLKKILFIDFFNPGLDLLKYCHEQQNISCTYGSLLHGGSFLDDDLYHFSWLEDFEKAWGGLYEHIYVPSNFLKRQIPKNLKKKTKVVPWGMDHIHTNSPQKKDIDVIFPHRLNDDKGIKDFIKIINLLPNIQFVVTAPQQKNSISSNQYYKKLQKCKNVSFVYSQGTASHLKILSRARMVLSCAKQENFGYAILKAIKMSCTPVLPNRLVYPELFSKKFLYKDIREAVDVIARHCSKKKSQNSTLLDKTKNKIEGFSFLKLINHFFWENK